MKLGIYVGSFNPPHKGHIKVANYLIKNNIVDKLLILPTPNYSNKTDLINASKRLDMLRLCVSNNVIVDDIHNNYPYTYMILESIQKDYPKYELYLIIGSDNLEKFHLWKNIDEILKYRVIVMNRGSKDIYRYLERFDISKFIVIDKFPFIDISSTEIRKNLNSKYLHKKVLKYIKKNNLYR